MHKHARIALAFVLGVVALAIVVPRVYAATTSVPCTLSDVTLTCTLPETPPVTVTETQTATAAATVTATVTASPSASSTPSPTPTASPTSTPTQPPTGCAISTPNVPDGPDGKGGCFPGVSNTGPDAPASSMATYTGPCTISAANVVIADKVVNCSLRLGSGASGFVLKNSYLFGSISQSSGTPSFTVQDVLIDGGVQKPACSNGACPAGRYACENCGVDGSNFTILRTEVINTNRAAWCNSCTIADSYFHGTNLWPDPSNKQHASAVRMDQNGVIRHNTLWCSYVGPFYNDDPGCSADLSGYPDFQPVRNNTIDGNLFVASQYSGFCAYGGGTGGKPYSGDSTNATGIKFLNNTFQRTSTNDHGQPDCGSYGPVTDFKVGRAGNEWTNNRWADGSLVPAA